MNHPPLGILEIEGLQAVSKMVQKYILLG